MTSIMPDGGEAKDVVLKKEMQSTQKGVEQVVDFLWAGATLTRIPTLMDKTVLRWTGSH